MTYVFYFISFFILELIYFRIANKYNIIDHPNERSSHTRVTLRGGGVIFPAAILVWGLYSGFIYPYFMTGLLLISIISFLDDLHTLSGKLRLFIQVLAVSLLFYQLELFSFSFWLIPMSYVLVIGVINAYNFMDGINGITGLYSLVLVLSLIYVNRSHRFIEPDILIVSGLALLVFLFFNFRVKAICFAGDVGSVSIAFIILFALSLLILHTGQPIYILFLAVYGVDTIYTIIKRLLRKKNIFKAHRSHAYQLLSNERGIPQLWVAASYAGTQLMINFLVIMVISFKLQGAIQLLFALLIIMILTAFYFMIVWGKQHKVENS